MLLIDAADDDDDSSVRMMRGCVLTAASISRTPSKLSVSGRSQRFSSFSSNASNRSAQPSDSVSV